MTDRWQQLMSWVPAQWDASAPLTSEEIGPAQVHKARKAGFLVGVAAPQTFGNSLRCSLMGTEGGFPMTLERHEFETRKLMSWMCAQWDSSSLLTPEQAESVLKAFVEACVPADLQKKFVKEAGTATKKISARFFRRPLLCGEDSPVWEKGICTLQLLFPPFWGDHAYRVKGSLVLLPEVCRSLDQDALARIEARDGVLYCYYTCGQNVFYLVGPWRSTQRKSKSKRGSD